MPPKRRSLTWSNPEQGEILRAMTDNDYNEAAHMDDQASREFTICQQYVQKLNMQMQLVDIEHVFGGERVVIYYLAENRVDFRELVRELAREFQTRIEMRQIGVRDEAKLLADYGDCGKPVCCGSYLSEMPPVSMKMAKIQKATLDPTKISGRCGRLKCCLRYEYDTYKDLQRDLPPIGSEIVTTTGKALVIAHEILAGQLLVESEDNRRVLIDADDVLSVIRYGRSGGSKQNSRPTSRTPVNPISIHKLLQADPRYKLDAYQFVRDSLAFAHDVMQMDSGATSPHDDQSEERHLTGQQLCHAIRELAVEQFGYMAKPVLNNWGIHSDQ